MNRPSLMTAHLLDVVSGYWDQSAIQYVTEIAASVTFDPPSGRVLHLNANGEYETGCEGHQMPLFAWNNPTDPSVSNLGTDTAGNFVHQPVLPPGGRVTTLVCTNGYECETTEFADLDYAPNDLLTATVANTNAATGGKLTNAGTTAGGDTICGVVSRGVFTDHNGHARLAFWMYFLPVVA